MAEHDLKAMCAAIEAQKPTFKRLLPASVSVEAFVRVTLHALWQRPELLTAGRRSLFGALLAACRLGLMPDGREGFIDVFERRLRDGKVERVAVWMPMVDGLIQLAYRCGVKSLVVDVVRENDYWELERGDCPRIVHRPNVREEEAGPLLWAYAIATMADGMRHHAWVSRADVERARRASRAPNGQLWSTWEAQAWKKTAIHRLAKILPRGESPDAERLAMADFEGGELEAAEAPGGASLTGDAPGAALPGPEQPMDAIAAAVSAARRRRKEPEPEAPAVGADRAAGVAAEGEDAAAREGT